MASVTEMYRLGLFSARCRLLAFRYVEPSKEEAEADAGTATAKDAATVIILALQNYLLQQTELTDRFSPDRFIEQLRQVSVLDTRSLSLTNTQYRWYMSRGKMVLVTHIYRHMSVTLHNAQVTIVSSTGAHKSLSLSLSLTLHKILYIYNPYSHLYTSTNNHSLMTCLAYLIIKI